MAKVQSLKKGAETVGAASSTISEQIKRLEQKLGKKLFNRSSNGLTLTLDGQELFDRSKGIFEEEVKEDFESVILEGF